MDGRSWDRRGGAVPGRPRVVAPAAPACPPHAERRLLARPERRAPGGGCWRGPPAARRERPRSRPAARHGARRVDAPDPGATRGRQDLHRGADDRRSRRGGPAVRPAEASRGHRQQPQGDRQPARCRRGGGGRAGDDHPHRPEARHERGSNLPPRHELSRQRGPRQRPAEWRDRRRGRDRLVLGAPGVRSPAGGCRGPGPNGRSGPRHPLSGGGPRGPHPRPPRCRRGRPDLARQRGRRGARRSGAWSCSAILSSSTSRSRGPTRREPSARPSPISSASTPPCRPSAGSSSSGPGASIRTSARSPPRRSTRAAWPPSPGWSARASTASRPSTGRGSGSCPSPTQGNRNDSPEEAERVAAIARAIVEGGARWVDSAGVSRPVGWRDVLVVAPYNAHVAEIARRLPAEARVGTVDKFQGQEAPISIYAMATSTPEDAPRGMDFLYSLNRLNVATSRARCCAAIVASPGADPRPLPHPQADAPRQRAVPRRGDGGGVEPLNPRCGSRTRC